MVSTRPQTSKSSSPFNNPLVPAPKAPIAIGIIVTFMFHILFNSLARSTYLSFFSLSFNLFCDQPGQQNIQFYKFSFTIRSGLLAEIRWSVCMLKSHRSLCVSFSRTGTGLYIYHLFVWINLNFLHISQWIALPTQPCLVLYSFCANLLHSLIFVIIIIIIHFRVFHTSVSWWFSIGVWVTASLLKSPGLWSILWPLLIMLSFLSSCPLISKYSKYLSFHFSFSFTQWSAGTAKSINRLVLFFLLIITWSGRLAQFRWSVCISKSQRSLCVSFFRTDSWLCI